MANETLRLAEQVHKVFKAFDADGNGKISLAELKELLQRLDPGTWSDDNCHVLLAQLDRNKDGVIDVSEFVNFMCDDRAVATSRSTLLSDDLVRAREAIREEERQRQEQERQRQEEARARAQEARRAEAAEQAAARREEGELRKREGAARQAAAGKQAARQLLAAAREARDTHCQAALDFGDKQCAPSLANLGRPPPGVVDMVVVVAYLLYGEESPLDWAAIQSKILGGRELHKFCDDLIRCDGRDFPRGSVARAEALLTEKSRELTYEALRGRSVAASYLCVWAVSILKFHHAWCKLSKQVPAPLPEGLDVHDSLVEMEALFA